MDDVVQHGWDGVIQVRRKGALRDILQLAPLKENRFSMRENVKMNGAYEQILSAETKLTLKKVSAEFGKKRSLFNLRLHLLL